MILSIVISAYNEEGNIYELYNQLVFNLQKFTNLQYELLFVNDGSTDKTLEKCIELNTKDKCVKIINFARNFGHEIAMTAGLDYAKGNAVIFMDADLQHPPHLIPEMIEKWQSGYEVVLTKRLDNEGQSYFGKLCGFLFYKLINILSEVPIPANTPDFRLIGKRYIDILRKIDERDRMFRGLLNWVGISNAAEISFIAPKRFSGKTHYNFIKSLSLAVSSVVQFSIKPLRFATYIGIISAIIACCFGVYTIFEHFVETKPSNGYATLVCIIAFFSSIQMVMIGILGEYIARIHIETKGRPLYFAELIE